MVELRKFWKTICFHLLKTKLVFTNYLEYESSEFLNFWIARLLLFRTSNKLESSKLEFKKICIILAIENLPRNFKSKRLCHLTAMELKLYSKRVRSFVSGLPARYTLHVSLKSGLLKRRRFFLVAYVFLNLTSYLFTYSFMVRIMFRNPLNVLQARLSKFFLS